MLRNVIFIFSNIRNYILFKIFDSKIGKRSKIRGSLIRCGRGTVEIGDDTIINSSIIANPLGGNKTVLYALHGGKIKIGNRVGISNSILIARELIEIEDDVLIGSNVKIYDNDFHSLNADLRGKGVALDIPVCSPVVIKRKAFIGAHSIILKGVTIGEYAIIGAGSVVAKDIPAHEIWAGNPARFIRSIDLEESNYEDNA